MAFQPKSTRNKVKSTYKTLYISEALVEQIEKLATANDTSFNNVVISMIEYCLDEEKN